MHTDDQTGKPGNTAGVIAAEPLEAAKVRCLLLLAAGSWFTSGPTAETLETVRFAISWLGETAPDVLERIGPWKESFGEDADLSGAQKDFARVFCVGRELFPSSESVYRTGLMMQEPRDEMRRRMRASGLELAPDERLPEDHLGAALTFGYQLLKRDVEAYEGGRSGEENSANRFDAYAAERLQWIREAEPLAENLPDGPTKILLRLARITLEPVWPRW